MEEKLLLSNFSDSLLTRTTVRAMVEKLRLSNPVPERPFRAKDSPREQQNDKSRGVLDFE